MASASLFHVKRTGDIALQERFALDHPKSSAVATFAYRNVVIADQPWRNKASNEGLMRADEAAAELLGDPDKGDQVTCGPGPFSMASADVVSDQLTAAGFTDIAFARSDAELQLGASLAEAVDFALTIGPAAERLRLAGNARRSELERAVHAALTPFARTDGVYMRSSTWIVTAQRGT